MNFQVSYDPYKPCDIANKTSTFASSFEHVRKPCDIAAINSAEIASSLHRRFETATQLSVTKVALKKCDKKRIKITGLTES